MSSNATRRKDTGRPGNGGKYDHTAGSRSAAALDDALVDPWAADAAASGEAFVDYDADLFAAPGSGLADQSTAGQAPFEETFAALIAEGPDRVETLCRDYWVSRDELAAEVREHITDPDGVVSETVEGYLARQGDARVIEHINAALAGRENATLMGSRGLNRCGGCHQFVSLSPPVGAEHVCAARIGRDAERISVAEARRLLAPGTRLQTVYPSRAQEEPDVRIVTKQTEHQMVSVRVAGVGDADGNGIDLDRNGVYNDWAKKSVERDANGTLIVRDEDGTPYVAFIPLDGTLAASINGGGRAIPLDDLPPFDPALVPHVLFARRTEDTETLAALAKSPLMVDRRAVAENPNTPADVLSHLAEDEEAKVRRKVAGHPNTDPDTLWRLAADEDPGDGLNEASIGYRVAANPAAPAEALARLASRDDEAIRNRVASHPNTSTRDLVYLATTPRPGQSYVDGQTRQNLAANPNTPSDILAGWERSDGWTMPNVAKNPSTPVDVLERLSTNTSTGNQTRAMVAKNPSAPYHVLKRLAGEEDRWVREHAASNPRLGQILEPAAIAPLIGDPDHRVRRAIAANPSISSLDLVPLAGDPDPFVRSTTAKNPNIGTGSMLALSADENSSVRMSLARNPAVPIEIIQRLAREEGNVGEAAQIALAERAK